MRLWYAYNGMGLPSKMRWEIDERPIERPDRQELEPPTPELHASVPKMISRA